MIKKITSLVALAVGLNWIGIARAEITSECSLSGNGDYLCAFSNKGSKKDNVCVHMILGADDLWNIKFAPVHYSGERSTHEMSELLYQTSQRLYRLEHPSPQSPPSVPPHRRN